MSLFLGIDLGSTTTKAVLMDADERILGRGITNTRSDYHVATSVAENEARISARFTLMRRQMIRDGLDHALERRLEDHFGLAAFRYRLERLRRLALEEAAAHPRAGRLLPALERIFNCMLADLAGDPDAPGRLRRSFFRDLAGSAFMTLAEAEAPTTGIDFEDLMAVFDIVILREENSVLDLPFAPTLQAAPALAQAEASIRSRLERAVAAADAADLAAANMVGTGYGRQRLPFRKDQIRSEILCHGLGAHFFFPATRTVLDIGGQDTKAIQVNKDGVATNFQMNDRCAAGCGRYLGYIADELGVSLDELGPMALEAERTVPVSSTCTVFAGAELRERLELGERRADILAGLHRAIVLRAVSILARSGGIEEEFTFTGGVARNPAVVHALRELVAENYGDRTLNIHPDSIYTGAVGAALYARRDLPAPHRLEEAAL